LKVRTTKKIILVFASVLLAIGSVWGYALAKRAFLLMAVETLRKVTGSDVKLKEADVRLSGTVLIDDIVIRPNRPAIVDDAIFKAKHVQAKFGLLSLLKRDARLKRVAVEDFVVNVQYDVNQARWNTDVLKSLREVGLSNRIPELNLRKGVIKYSKVWGGVVSDVIAMPVDATFKAFDKEGDTLSVNMRGVKGASLSGTWRTVPSGRVMLTGQLSTASVPLFENVWDMSKIAIVVSYDSNTINFEDCRMRLGDETTLLAAGHIDDYRRRGIFSIEAHIRNLHHGPDAAANTFVYSKSLLENLPGRVCQKFFGDFRPKGVVDIDVKANGAFNELAATKCTGVLQCRDVSVVYKDFPYPIDHIKGTIDFNDRMIVLNRLDAKHGDADLVIDGYSKDFLPIWDCNLSIESPSMPLDDDVYNALDADQKRAWAVISPQGNIGMKYRFVREPDGARHMTVIADLQKVDATYRRFQFPLKSLTGMMLLDLKNDKTSFNNVVSEYDGRRIVINGWTKLKGQKWSEEPESDTDSYCLTLDADGLELEKDVAPLLPPRAAKMLLPLKASGKVRIVAGLSNNADEKCQQKKLTIECLGDAIDYTGFSYPLRDIRGKLTLSADEIEFENMTAKAAGAAKTAAEASIKLTGKAKFSQSSLKVGQFKVIAEDLPFDQRLGTLLGKAGQDIYQRLSPRGTANIDLDSLQITKDGNDVNSVNVKGEVLFKDCSFSSMLPVTSLDGRLNVDASYTGKDGLKSLAQVDINSVKVKEKLLKSLLADVAYDGSKHELEIKNISADFYGGKFIGAFALSDANADSAGYTLSAMCDRINLKDFLASGSGDNSPDYISGVMSGTLDVNSQGQLTNGKLQLNITDMQAAKTSFLGKLLMVLRLTEPRDYAFDNMIVTGYLHNNELLVEQMDLGGDAFGLRGDGTVDIDKNTINLHFIAAGPRLTREPSMLGSLAEGLSPAMARVTVTGDFTDPQIEQTTLPVLKDTLEIFGTKNEEPEK
jgi:hypothetical protein